MIDAHACIISNDMVGSTFEHNFDCPEFRYPLDVMFHLPYWGISPYFIDEMIWLQ